MTKSWSVGNLSKDSEPWGDLARDKNKWQGFILLSWSYCSYQQTVPLLPPPSPFSTFLILAYQFWESLDILPLNSFSLLLATSSWYNQVDRQKWKNRPWKISFKICFITGSLSHLFKEPTFATGYFMDCTFVPPEYHQIHLVETDTQRDGIRRWAFRR